MLKKITVPETLSRPIKSESLGMGPGPSNFFFFLKLNLNHPNVHPRWEHWTLSLCILASQGMKFWKWILSPRGHPSMVSMAWSDLVCTCLLSYQIFIKCPEDVPVLEKQSRFLTTDSRENGVVKVCSSPGISHLETDLSWQQWFLETSSNFCLTRPCARSLLTHQQTLSFHPAPPTGHFPALTSSSGHLAWPIHFL